MIDLVKVIEVEVVGDATLRIRFSDGREGVRDFADVIAEGGPMVEPLSDPRFFARAFVEHGVPTWPNGFDVDAIRLHMEMRDQGLLRPAAA